ncbi:MAG: metallophosphoesterase [Actinomycetota bacterium]|nr:metallophosphoesterase [Actinomycetota bacterium]
MSHAVIARSGGLVALVLALSLMAPAPAWAGDPVIMAAGDIACPPAAEKTPTACHHKETSDILVAADPNKVLTMGDNQYQSGKLWAFRRSYDDTWGRVKRRTRPTPGNHEYLTPGAQGYFDYFGDRARPRGRSYYSFDVGEWHVIALNSEIDTTRSSRQVEWLRKDLASDASRCTLAYWHTPLFSSGEHGNAARVRTFWRKLYADKADLVLNGHDHDYERFAPMEPDGDRNTIRGLREFVVGTGGIGFRPFETIKENSVARNDHTFGVLKLTLHPRSYDFEFVAEAGGTYEDAGTATCH